MLALRVASLWTVSVLACGTTPAVVAMDAETASDFDESFAVCGARLPGDEAVDVEVNEGRIAAVRPAGRSELCARTASVDAGGQWLAPAFIDSHVHLVFYDVAEELAAGGVSAAVDLAAPIDSLGQPTMGPRMIAAGPMITAIDGYPTQSWGSAGYGLETQDAAEAVAAVDELKARGAGLIKVPLTGEPTVSDAVLEAIVSRAHELDLKVAVHALGDDEAMRGASFGADLLAHTPTEALSQATLEAWKGRAVVSTLDAFGASNDASQNLLALREHQVTVLYGTDLGNSFEVGIQAAEIEALLSAGFDGPAIVDIGTRVPAQYWGWEDLGSVEVGQAASFVLLDADPHSDPVSLSRPLAVLIDGLWMQGNSGTPRPPVAGG